MAEFFKNSLSISFTDAQAREIRVICREYKGVFSSEAHFIRSAVNYFIRARIKTGMLKDLL